MRVIRHLARVGSRLPRVVLTLGNFDGVHRGHQAILARAVAEARSRGGQTVALTFHPHPVMVLAAQRAPGMIQSLHDRLATLRRLGVDVAVVQRFTREFASHDPDAFITRDILPSLDLAHVVVGYNVNFGRNRAGTAETLRALGASHGFSVEAVGPVAEGDAAVSSSGVRRAVAAGDVATARLLLGRPYGLRGRVVTGEQRGRTLGFPTANLHVGRRLVLPADGVYAVYARAGGAPMPAVLNVGVRPTFGELRRTIEAHVLDWQGDLYGRWLELAFVAHLRGERRFSGPDELRRAIADDVVRARAALAASP
ncbi:MAG TPA: bifunctional riboflavin kinase/FAD synthetase [Candidatus Eisenbacteria bacterium]|nr:bifunctional riboflavin kinase/FAD synthetase [Candidatus Eisenbacteria bacterium]